MKRQHRTCRGCREARPGLSVEVIGHVCHDCEPVLDELVAIMTDEAEQNLVEVRAACAELDRVLACFAEAG